MVKFKETNEKIPDNQINDDLPDKLPDKELTVEERKKMLRKGYYTSSQNTNVIEKMIRKYSYKIRVKKDLEKNSLEDDNKG
jgi:hypothetical protein